MCEPVLVCVNWVRVKGTCWHDNIFTPLLKVELTSCLVGNWKGGEPEKDQRKESSLRGSKELSNISCKVGLVRLGLHKRRWFLFPSSFSLLLCSFTSPFFFPFFFSTPLSFPPPTAGVSVWQWDSALPAPLAESSFLEALNRYLYLLNKYVALEEREKEKGREGRKDKLEEGERLIASDYGSK